MEFLCGYHIPTVVIVAVSFMVVNTAVAQIGSLDGRTPIGLSQQSGAGVFTNPVPATLGSGNIGLGIFYTGEFGSSLAKRGVPIAVGFGVAHQLEAAMAFKSLRSGTTEEQRTMFGIKTNLYHSARSVSMLSVDLRYHRIQRTFLQAASQDIKGGSLRIIAGQSLWTLAQSYVHIGYAWTMQKQVDVDNHVIAGGGITASLGQYTLLGMEINIGNRLDHGHKVGGTIGIKHFLLNHLQLSSGFQVQQRRDSWVPGLFFGLSFSSEMLRRKSGATEPTLLPAPPSLDDLDMELEENKNKEEEPIYDEQIDNR